MAVSKPLWVPDRNRIKNCRMTEFASHTGIKFADYEALHRWSVSDGGAFWDVLWDYAGVVGEKGARIVENENLMPGASYFPDAKINYAENLLQIRGDTDALVFRAEDKHETRMNWDSLHALVSKLQQAFLDKGLKKGDRVAAMMPNMPETIAAMLAVTSIGAVWSSCSPDFGVKGVLDRFGQLEPKFLIACDGYWYNGKRIEIAEKLDGILMGLGCELNLIVPLLGSANAVASNFSDTVSLDEFLAGYSPKVVEFERVPFNHPLFVMFSSGTTGVPKCIVHSHGGVLLQIMKEQQLHVDVREGDKVFYFTTCGWMMWNWLVTALASGATLILFDGSPFAPNANVLFDYAENEGFSVFGTSAKFIDALRNSGHRPIETHDLSDVRLIASTGSPLAPENYDFVYSGIKADVHLASMSGGTDIMGCFVGGVPWKPVYNGEIQGPILGMDVQVWDDDGKAVQSGKGELVCVHAFPSMPIEFLNDPDGSKYHGAYFDRFKNIWCHGDFAEWTENGGMVIHGRSDATLNPGGVRIGTAEIYNQVEQMPEIEEALCIGQQWEGDVRVVLFVRTKEDVDLTDALQAQIRQKIRTGASPRHVPAVIVAVADIPRTKSGKITELAVRDVVHGREVKNREALANPEALDLFEDLPELRG